MKKGIKHTLFTFVFGFILLIISLLLFQKDKLYMAGLIVLSGVNLILYIISFSGKKISFKNKILVFIELVIILLLANRSLYSVGAVYGLLISQIIHSFIKIIKDNN